METACDSKSTAHAAKSMNSVAQPAMNAWREEHNKRQQLSGVRRSMAWPSSSSFSLLLERPESIPASIHRFEAPIDRSETLRSVGHVPPSNHHAATMAAVRFLLTTLLVALAFQPVLAFAQSDYELDDLDLWKPSEAPQSLNPMLQQAQLALANNEGARAIALADNFMEQNPLSPARAEALLIKGDALLSMDNEWQALFAYEEVARRYANTASFVPALEREFDVARAYAYGLRRRFLGTFRWIDAGDDAQEIFIRIQERLPGSELAEKAGMELGDYYFRIRDMPLAADAYDLFVQNYPRSRQVVKARLRLIYSYYAQFKGPEFEGKGLEEATVRLKQLQADEPAVAQKIGSESLLIRIYESEAARLKSQADWYTRVHDWIAAELSVRALVQKYPNSVAAIEALRTVPAILEQLPASVIKTCPNYAALRLAIVGIDRAEPVGILPQPQPALPNTSQTKPETPVPGAIEPDPNAAQGPENQVPPRSVP